MWQVSATIWVLLQTNCTMRERMSLLSRRFAPHLAIKEVFEIARVPVVNVLHVAAAALRSAGISRAAVFGNRAVMQSSILGMLQENRVMKLGADLLEGILETYTAIALDGKRGSPQEVQYLSETTHELIEKGAKAIILAGSDLSSFYADDRTIPIWIWRSCTLRRSRDSPNRSVGMRLQESRRCLIRRQNYVSLSGVFASERCTPSAAERRLVIFGMAPGAVRSTP